MKSCLISILQDLKRELDKAQSGQGPLKIQLQQCRMQLEDALGMAENLESRGTEWQYLYEENAEHSEYMRYTIVWGTAASAICGLPMGVLWT